MCDWSSDKWWEAQAGEPVCCCRKRQESEEKRVQRNKAEAVGQMGGWDSRPPQRRPGLARHLWHRWGSRPRLRWSRRAHPRGQGQAQLCPTTSLFTASISGSGYAAADKEAVHCCWVNSGGADSTEFPDRFLLLWSIISRRWWWGDVR